MESLAGFAAEGGVPYASSSAPMFIEIPGALSLAPGSARVVADIKQVAFCNHCQAKTAHNYRRMMPS
jgi:hypothetical protein